MDTNTDSCNFIILFKGVLGRTDFRALYRFDEVSGQGVKVHGAASAPDIVTHDMVDGFFKYDSGAKEFTALRQQRHFTATTDGISLKKEF